MENKTIVIGIEGLVGSGKTSICRELLKRDKNRNILEKRPVSRGVFDR